MILFFVFPFTFMTVKNVFKHVFFFYVHGIKVMVEQIDLPIRKLLENTLFYLIMGQTKTRKLLFTTQYHNTLTLRHAILHQKNMGV